MKTLNSSSNTLIIVLNSLESFLTLSEEEINTGLFFDTSKGLCHAFPIDLMDRDDKVELFSTWEHCDPVGSWVYPIPCDPTTPITKKFIRESVPDCPTGLVNYYLSRKAAFAYDHLPKYTGHYLELRKSLAKHCVSCIKECLSSRGEYLC